MAGSAAAPTAGLHFTPHLLQEIANHNIQIEYITLHVGLGTSTTRALESCAISGQLVTDNSQLATDLFIYPPYKFKFVDSLITNFHLPQTSLLMLVAAIYPKTLDAYRFAIANRYRFYSFGDACWVI